MLIIASVLVLSFGFSSIFAGTIPLSSLPQFEDVVLRNKSTTQCMKIMDDNLCPPGNEIIKECDYWRGPMKCVPCKDEFYQCNYLTSDSPWIKCYQQHCPDQGTETIVEVTLNADGTCQVNCVCNEAMGYSGSDYKNCILQKTVCGINSELKNGVCVGCSEGFENPNEHFGRCVPAPTTSSVPTSLDGNFKQSTPPPSVKSYSSPRPTPRHTVQSTSSTSSTPDKPLPDRTEVSKSDKIQGIGFGSAALLVLIVLTVLCLIMKKGGKIICCSKLIKYDKVAQDIGPGASSTASSITIDIPCPPAQPAQSAQPAQPACPPGSAAVEQASVHIDNNHHMFNIILIFAKADEDLAFEINKLLNKMLLKDGVRVKAWDFNDPSFGGSIMNLPKQFTAESCLILVVMTDNTLEDSVCEFMTHEAVALTRLKRKPKTKTYSVRPLHTQPPNERNYGIPDGLASIIPVDWFGPKCEDKLRELCIHLLDESTASSSE